MTQTILTTIPVNEFMSLLEEKVKEAIVNLLPVFTQTYQQERPITTKEVCQLLGKSEVTISNWKKEGKIKAHRIPGSNKNYYYESEVLAALKPASWK